MKTFDTHDRGFCAVVLATVFVVGCGDSGPATYSVSGNVSYGGQPLEHGEISFSIAKLGAINTTRIVDGRYERELEAGTYRVEIHSFKKEMVDVAGQQVETAENQLPDRYSIDSTLTATVTPEGPNEFDFAMSQEASD